MKIKHLFYVLLILLPAVALADTTSVLPTPEVVKDHSALFSWVLGVAIIVALFLFAKVVNTHEENSKKQWEKIDKHEDRLDMTEKEILVMKTEHKRNHPGSALELGGIGK